MSQGDVAEDGIIGSMEIEIGMDGAAVSLMMGGSGLLIVIAQVVGMMPHDGVATIDYGYLVV